MSVVTWVAEHQWYKQATKALAPPSEENEDISERMKISMKTIQKQSESSRDCPRTVGEMMSTSGTLLFLDLVHFNVITWPVAFTYKLEARWDANGMLNQSVFSVAWVNSNAYLPVQGKFKA